MYENNRTNRVRESILSRDLVVRARDRYAAARLELRRLHNGYRHDAPIDPLELYRLNPSEITRAMRPFDGPARTVAGTVVDGDWDRSTAPFEALDGAVHFDVLRSFERRFEEGVPWEETAFYETLMAEVERGNVWWDCSSKEDVAERCRTIDRLYRKIRDEGYLTQRRLQEREDSGPLATEPRPEVYRKVNGEVAITVGRSGEPIFYDGRHRLAIAKILDLESIPVVILVRHERWQALRDAIARGEVGRSELPGTIRDHPDLEELF